MLQRRVAWSALAFLSLASLTGSGGCRDESSGAGENGAPSQGTTAPLNVSATRRGEQLLEHVQSTFRTPSPTVIEPPVGKGGTTAKTVASAPLLTASPIVQFNVDGDVIRPVPLASRKGEPIATIGLPRVGNGALSIAVSGLAIEVRPRGFAATAVEWSDRIAVYPDVQDGTHAFRRVDESGVEDFYEVATPREELSFTYDVALKNVAGLRLVGSSLELLDAGGTPRLASSAPVVIDAKGVRRVGHLEVSGCAYDTSTAGPWGRPVTAPGNTTCVVTAKIDAKGLAFPVLVDPAWRPTFDTRQTHAYHKMLLIPAGTDAGKVLLVAGAGSASTTTELFDPATNTWADAGVIPDAAGLGEGCNAVVLPNGTVLVAGGFPTSGTTTNAKSTAIKRSPTGVWSFAGSMVSPRAWFAMHVVTVAGKVQVLAAGGQPKDTTFSSPPHKTAELYDPDPATDRWTATSSMKSGHSRLGSAKLSDGKVLVVGGYATTDTASSAADLFDPATATWSTTTPAMNTSRGAPIVVPVSTGAAVFGGFDSSLDELSQDTIEYWDGTAFRNVTSKLTEPRAYGAGVLLDDGRALVTGGQTNVTDSFGGFTNGATESADIFAPGTDPKTGTIVGTAAMGTARRWHALVNLPTKGVLATGGDNGTSAVKISEIFDTSLGRPCGSTACPSGTFCTEGVCCERSSCPEGQTCATPGHEGVCTKPKGSACTTASECATGHCVESVCCDTSCTGDCRSCKTTGKVGTCTFAALGTDPGARCFSAGDDPGCGQACDGAGSCSYYPPAGTPCGGTGGDGGADTGSFCNRSTCSGFGSCSVTTFDCGLTCTTSVSCNESTKTCSASGSGIKAGYCVIDSTCYTYGDINPKNTCQTCDPTSGGSKTAWSVAAACKEAGVEDTGTDGGLTDSGAKDSGPKDTGVADTSTSSDTGTSVDSSVDDAGAPDNSLPEKAACSCTTPGNDRAPSLAAGLALALAGVVVARRRRR